jgi:hypothetical protein
MGRSGRPLTNDPDMDVAGQITLADAAFSTGASRRGLVPISMMASACSIPAMVELKM